MFLSWICRLWTSSNVIPLRFGKNIRCALTFLVSHVRDKRFWHDYSNKCLLVIILNISGREWALSSLKEEWPSILCLRDKVILPRKLLFSWCWLYIVRPGYITITFIAYDLLLSSSTLCLVQFVLKHSMHFFTTNEAITIFYNVRNVLCFSLTT